MKMNHYAEVVSIQLTDGSKAYDVTLKGTRISVSDESFANALAHYLDVGLNDPRVVGVVVKE